MPYIILDRNPIFLSSFWKRVFFLEFLVWKEMKSGFIYSLSFENSHCIFDIFEGQSSLKNKNSKSLKLISITAISTNSSLQKWLQFWELTCVIGAKLWNFNPHTSIWSCQRRFFIAFFFFCMSKHGEVFITHSSIVIKKDGATKSEENKLSSHFSLLDFYL